jgi:non-heme chloroperoxidase
VAGRPDTVEEAAAHPEAFAHKSIGQVADHFETIIRGPDQKSAVIGHSFGGLLTQILAGRGLARVSVAIDPAPFRGVLPLPISSLKSAFLVLGNPANRSQRRRRGRGQRAVRDLRRARLGRALFQAATANLNP